MASLPPEINVTLDEKAKEIIVRFTEALEAFNDAIIAAGIALQDFRLAAQQVQKDIEESSTED